MNFCDTFLMPECSPGRTTARCTFMQQARAVPLSQLCCHSVLGVFTSTAILGDQGLSLTKTPFRCPDAGSQLHEQEWRGMLWGNRRRPERGIRQFGRQHHTSVRFSHSDGFKMTSNRGPSKLACVFIYGNWQSRGQRWQRKKWEEPRIPMCSL